MYHQATAVNDLLDAAERCFRRAGVRGTTIEEVATEAGVSRITVYRRVGTRDDLVRLVLLRSVDRMLDGLRPRLRATGDLGEALVQLVLRSLRAARGEDLQLLYASDEGSVAGRPLPGLSAALFGRYGTVVGELADTLPGRLAPGMTAAEAGEWVLRIVISLLTIESDLPPRELLASVRRLVLPALVADAQAVTT